MRGAMNDGGVRQPKSVWPAAWLTVLLALPLARGATPPQHVCQRLTVEGEVNTGQEWKVALGDGWVFRVLPIAAAPASASGWDLVLDREPPAGYPDALLLATLPYGSINEREIATTFGLRAQDAIGWNPRTFRFVSDPQQFHKAQRWFLELMRSMQSPNPTSRSVGADPTARLLELAGSASSGQLRILDARIVPGIADPQPYAQGWALAASRTQHEIEAAPAGQASALGKLLWMRFALTLWLPSHWRPSAGFHPARLPCPQ